MTIEQVFVGDVGTVFKATIKDNGVVVDLSSATLKEIIFKKPDGSRLTKTALFYTDGTDGIIVYTAVAGDLDLAGMWQWQARITVTSGGPFSTEVKDFRVVSTL